MEKRILIKEDKEKFNEISQDLKQFLPILNELKDSYEAFEIGPFNNEVFKKLLLVGSAEFEEKYIDKLNNELDALKISSSIIRKNSIEGHKINIIKLQEVLQKVKSFRPRVISTEGRPVLKINQISFDNKFHISEIDKENILDAFCRIYLEDENEIQNMEIVKNLQKAFNEYLEFVENADRGNYNKMGTLVYALKIDENGKAAIYPEGFKNLCTYQKRKQEYEKTMKI